MRPILPPVAAALLIFQVSNVAAQPQQDATPALSPVEGTWLSTWGPVTFVPQVQADGIHIRGFLQQWPSQKGTARLLMAIMMPPSANSRTALSKSRTRRW